MNFLVPPKKAKIHHMNSRLSELHGFSLDLPPHKSTKRGREVKSIAVSDIISTHFSGPDCQGVLSSFYWLHHYEAIYIYIYILVMFFFCACLSLLESLRQVISFGDGGWGECWPGPSNWIKGVSCISSRISLKICCIILSLRTDIRHGWQ